MASPAAGDAAGGEAAREAARRLDAAVERVLACVGRQGREDAARQALDNLEALLASGARGCDVEIHAGASQEAAARDSTELAARTPLLRCLVARSAHGEALAAKILAASADAKPIGVSLVLAASSGASVPVPKFADAGPDFAALRELLRRGGCAADATNDATAALHAVLRALPIGHRMRDSGRALDLVRALLAAGANARAPVLQGGEQFSVLSLVGDVAIGEELARNGAFAPEHHFLWLRGLVRLPLQQPPEYVAFLRQNTNPALHYSWDDGAIEAAMDCESPYDRNRLDTLELLLTALARDRGNLRGLRRMMQEAHASDKLDTFNFMLLRVCARLHPTYGTDYTEGAGTLRDFVRLILDANEAVRTGSMMLEDRWFTSFEKGDATLLRLLLDAGVGLPQGVDDLPHAAFVLIDAVTDAAQKSDDAGQPMRELLRTLAAACADAGDPRYYTPCGQLWQTVGVAVQTALDSHTALDTRAECARQAADSADAACVANWAAMRAHMNNMEAAVRKERAVRTFAAKLQPYMAMLHTARDRRVAAHAAASMRARLTAAIDAAMQTAPAVDDAVLQPVAAQAAGAAPELLTLRGTCGELVEVPREQAVRASEYLAAVTARWDAGNEQPIAVAELSAMQLGCFAAFLNEAAADDQAAHDTDTAWEAAARNAPSSVDWAALERAAERAAGADVELPRWQRAQRLLAALAAAGALGASRMQLAAALAAASALTDGGGVKRKSMGAGGTRPDAAPSDPQTSIWGAG